MPIDDFKTSETYDLQTIRVAYEFLLKRRPADMETRDKLKLVMAEINRRGSTRATRVAAAASVAALVSLTLLCFTGCSTAATTHGIPNLALVEPGIWRGGQPNAAGWAWLKSQGVIYDIKLNTRAEASDDEAVNQGMTIQDCGIINQWELTIGKPDPFGLFCSVESIGNHPGIGAVFIHCQHGQDRTGLVVGAYRVRIEGWSKQDAYREMIAHGFHPILRGLVRAWEEDVP